MNLKKISEEIRDCLNERREKLDLKFYEDEHQYFMKDNDGVVKDDFMSVSKLVKKFYKPFDSEGMALKMSRGDVVEQQKLLEQWKKAGDLSTNMGSRVHFMLESELVNQYDSYKDVRLPIFDCDDVQLNKSDKMIYAGKKYLNLMHERGAVLLDTEIVLGDPELGYVGQPDKVWLIETKQKDSFGFVITDWKTNQPKNFKVHHYTGKMYSPFNSYHDTALSHYYLQLPFYGRLLLKMLKGTKFDDVKLLGSVVVLLKDDGTYEEYRVPKDVSDNVMKLDLKKYTKYD